MHDINNLLPEHKLLFKQLQRSMTPEAFEVWYSNALILKGLPRYQWATADLQTMPNPMFKPKTPTHVGQAVANARQAVSGLSSNAATRKAVEALADAIDQSKEV